MMAEEVNVPTGSEQQPGKYVIMKVVNNDWTEEDWKNNYPLKAVKYTGIGHLVAAGMAFLSQIVLISLLQYAYMSAYYSGFWCGIFFAATGVIGLITAAKPGRCFNIAYIVLSVIAAIFAFTMLTMALTSITRIRYCANQVTVYYENQASSNTQSRNTYFEIERCANAPSVSVLFGGILVLVSITEASLSFASAIISGRAASYNSGCCNQYKKFIDSQAVYTDPQSEQAAVNTIY